jgi:A/G-specific adenine glycosylase
MIDHEFCSCVVSWFRENGRLLPWREGRDPYRIWISEIMLQQTRIEAVIPYYYRFLEALPDPLSLASVSEEQLLKLWEGLGYYSRARNLKKAAQMVMEQYGGKLPADAAALRSLPGIGDYTAGAIASIAYGLPTPAVDGNVLRVLARYNGDFRDIMLSSTKKSVTAMLAEVYPQGRAAGDLTEGIMEIGERICIPNGSPQCALCPLRKGCAAKAKGLCDQLPVKSAKKERKVAEMTVLLLSCQGRYALRKRPSQGLLAGMWEFFCLDGKKSKEEALACLKERGICGEQIASAGKAKHIFTHIEWNMTGYFVSCQSQTEDLVWETPEAIGERYAIPVAFHPFLKKIMKKNGD